MQLARRIGKVAVVSVVCPGIIGNRMLGGYGREAALLVLEGASPARVDRALTDFGMAMGPMAVGDLAGLDIGVRAADEARAAGRGSPDPRSGAVARRLVAMGRMGLKTGKGLYRYEPGSRSPLPDPEVESLIREEAGRLNVPQREVTDEEIVARCIYPLINEACLILEEGIALRPGDIDVVWTSGYGFPAYRGGPLFHADTIGVKQVFDAICRFGDRDGDPYGYWRPAPLLAALAPKFEIRNKSEYPKFKN